MTRGKFLKLLVVLVLAGLLLAACGETKVNITKVTGTKTYTGNVFNSDGFIALVPDGDKITAFATDGLTFAAWFKGSFPQGRLDLTADNGTKLTGLVNALNVTGALKFPDTKVLAFKATDIGNDTDGGLYQTQETLNGEIYYTGWVIFPDGQQRGAVTSKTTLQSAKIIQYFKTLNVPTPTPVPPQPAPR